MGSLLNAFWERRRLVSSESDTYAKDIADFGKRDLLTQLPNDHGNPTAQTIYIPQIIQEFE